MKSLVVTSDNQSEQWLTTFTDLYRNNILTDVTLICDDRVKINAHKIVLCAGSSLFRDFLVNNTHSHPLLFLKGVKQDQLKPLLQFLYHGQVKIAQDDLNDLLRIAQELEVLGLSDDTSIGHDAERKKMEQAEEKISTEKSFRNMRTDKMKSDSNNPNFSCNKCNFKGISQNSLSRHIALLHKNNDFEANPSEKELYYCLLCEFKGISPQSLEKHKSIMHNNENEEQFSQMKEQLSPIDEQISLIKEQLSPTEEQLPPMKEQLELEFLGTENYDCEHCEFKGISVESLKHHNQMLHDKEQSNEGGVFDPLTESSAINKETEFNKNSSEMQLECSSCSLKLQSTREARRHMKSDHDDQTIKVRCLLCTSIMSIDSIKPHYYSIHANQRFKCDLCNFDTNRLDSLKGHKLVIHENKYKYECQLCNFRANKPGLLYTHHLKQHSS